ncbi:hypothetical protein ACFQ2M_11380 [Kitasatospora saccharophila]|uniref:hypothetical protein n=1 Tax=Kitasatospora saccharophila TaxID=407973 RepID=UPI0036374E67
MPHLGIGDCPPGVVLTRVALVPHLGIGDCPPGVVLTRLPLYRRTRTAFRAGGAAHPAVAAFAAALHAAVPAELRSA